MLLKALERLEGVEGVAHMINPKALSKEDLYGVLDPNTREWTHIIMFVIWHWLINMCSILLFLSHDIQEDHRPRSWQAGQAEVDHFQRRRQPLVGQ